MYTAILSIFGSTHGGLLSQQADQLLPAGLPRTKMICNMQPNRSVTKFPQHNALRFLMGEPSSLLVQMQEYAASARAERERAQTLTDQVSLEKPNAT